MTRLVRRRGVRQFVKFGIVGTSGLLVNLLVFTLLQRTTPLPGWLLFSIGFMSGGVSNWFLNRRWTFRSDRHAGRESVQFLTVSLMAMLLGDVVYWLLYNVAGYHHGHQVWFAATVSGVLVNFFLNKYWTFRDA